jgi:hypothetical protein
MNGVGERPVTSVVRHRAVGGVSEPGAVDADLPVARWENEGGYVPAADSPDHEPTGTGGRARARAARGHGRP